MTWISEMANVSTWDEGSPVRRPPELGGGVVLRITAVMVSVVLFGWTGTGTGSRAFSVRVSRQLFSREHGLAGLYGPNSHRIFVTV